MRKILMIALAIVSALSMTIGTAISASATTITEAYNCSYLGYYEGTTVKHWYCNGYWFHNYGYPQRRLRIVADQTKDAQDWHTTRVTRIESTDATTKHFIYYCRNTQGARWQIGTGELGGNAPWFWDYAPINQPGGSCDGYGTGLEIRVADYTGAYVTWVQMNVTGFLGRDGVHAGVPESYR